MADLKSLVEQKNDLIQQMKTLMSSVEAEKRALTEDEVTRFNDLETQVKALDTTIEAQERARKLEMTENTPKEEKKMEETREALERRAFENYLRDVVEERANMEKGNNGAVIPASIANKIITRVHEISPLYAMATKYNVKGTLSIPFYPANAAANVTMDYASEFSDLTSTTGNFSAISLTGFLAGALTKVSRSLINNSQFNIVDFVINNMAETIAIWLEGQLIHGTTNKITGTIAGTTQSVTSASATAVTADELIKVQELVPDVYQGNACWIMSRATRTALRLLKDGENRYLLNPDATSEWGYVLLGKPVCVSENMENIAASKTTILYGDFSGLAVKLSEALEIQVLREQFATQHAVGVVAWMEADAKVENAQKLAKLVQHS